LKTKKKRRKTLKNRKIRSKNLFGICASYIKIKQQQQQQQKQSNKKEIGKSDQNKKR
jgi:hypothetical protein